MVAWLFKTTEILTSRSIGMRTLIGVVCLVSLLWIAPPVVSQESNLDDLKQQQQQIDGKKQSLSQNLNEKSYKFMDDIQKKLKDFLEEYNKEKNYMYIFTTGTGLDYMVYKDSSMNITADVIEGMNEKMKAAAKP